MLEQQKKINKNKKITTNCKIASQCRFLLQPQAFYEQEEKKTTATTISFELLLYCEFRMEFS